VSYVIGPGSAIEDLYDDWARLREVDESGGILVRPDGFVAWRSHQLAQHPEDVLAEVMQKILAR
jgi:2,4-dichlorophenol 6-monooxygenase